MSQSFRWSFDGKIAAPEVPGLLELSLPSAVKKKNGTLLALRKQDVSSCQASPLQHFSPLYLCKHLGVKREAPACFTGQDSYLLNCFGNNNMSYMTPQPFAEREGETWIMEGGWFGGACMAANLLHMEEIAFPSKMSFSSCLSCTGDDESQHALPCFVSASSFLSLQGRETANRHQRREQALIISCSGLLFPFLVISISYPLCRLKSICEYQYWKQSPTKSWHQCLIKSWFQSKSHRKCWRISQSIKWASFWYWHQNSGSSKTSHKRSPFLKAQYVLVKNWDE